MVLAKKNHMWTIYKLLARTVHGISIYCIYAVYDRIYAVIPYVPYVRDNGLTQNS
jgi:hypothetical protein